MTWWWYMYSIEAANGDMLERQIEWYMLNIELSLDLVPNNNLF